MSLFLSAYFICRKSQKNVLQKEVKNWIFEVYLLTEELSS